MANCSPTSAVFQAVVDAGGVTRAAQQLHRVQSNVTTRVKQLEEDLGVALFVREGRRMQLTRRRASVLARLRRSAHRARRAKRATRCAMRVRAACCASVQWRARPLSACRQPLLNRLQSRTSPTSPSSCATGNPQQLIGDSCSAVTLDAALVAEPVTDSRLESTPGLRRGARARVTRSGHPRDPASPRDIAPRTLLAFEPGLSAPPATRGVVRARAGHAGPHRRDGLVPRDPRLRGRWHGRR
mgnify:CR=1 FL=1